MGKMTQKNQLTLLDSLFDAESNGAIGVVARHRESGEKGPQSMKKVEKSCQNTSFFRNSMEIKTHVFLLGFSPRFQRYQPRHCRTTGSGRNMGLKCPKRRSAPRKRLGKNKTIFQLSALSRTHTYKFPHTRTYRSPVTPTLGLVFGAR